MGTFTLHPVFIQRQHNGNAINLTSTSIKIAVLKDTYTPSLAHDFWNDVSSHEVSGSGYTAGGTPISGATCNLDGNVTEWIFDDIEWAQNASGFEDGRTYLAYFDTGNPATSVIIGHMTEAANFGNKAGALTFDVSATDGAVRIGAGTVS